MVLQEAGALALPIITTKIPGASEVFADGESVRLVEARNKAQLKAAMLELIDNRQWAAQLGQQAYLRTKERYARPIMLENQRQDYLDILGQ
jgi:glycosyltransferase involved in cell wall biosynthesis